MGHTQCVRLHRIWLCAPCYTVHSATLHTMLHCSPCYTVHSITLCSTTLCLSATGHMHCAQLSRGGSKGGAADLASIRESLQHLCHRCAILSGYVMRALKLEIQLFALLFLQVGMLLFAARVAGAILYVSLV